LKETVTALERLRIGLLRLHGGLADLRPVTTALEAARAIDRDIGLLVEGQAEVSGVRRLPEFRAALAVSRLGTLLDDRRSLLLYRRGSSGLTPEHLLVRRQLLRRSAATDARGEAKPEDRGERTHTMRGHTAANQLAIEELLFEMLLRHSIPPAFGLEQQAELTSTPQDA
jgi:hypothetical protein